MDDNIAIGKRLEEFVLANFSSKGDFAKALGKSPQNVSNYFSGKTGIGAGMKKKLEEIGCDTYWLFTGRSSNHEYDERLKNLEEEVLTLRADVKMLQDAVRKQVREDLRRS